MCHKFAVQLLLMHYALIILAHLRILTHFTPLITLQFPATFQHHSEERLDRRVQDGVSDLVMLIR